MEKLNKASSAVEVYCQKPHYVQRAKLFLQFNTQKRSILINQMNLYFQMLRFHLNMTLKEQCHAIWFSDQPSEFDRPSGHTRVRSCRLDSPTGSKKTCA